MPVLLNAKSYTENAGSAAFTEKRLAYLFRVMGRAGLVGRGMAVTSRVADGWSRAERMAWLRDLLV